MSRDALKCLLLLGHFSLHVYFYRALFCLGFYTVAGRRTFLSALPSKITRTRCSGEREDDDDELAEDDDDDVLRRRFVLAVAS